MRQGDCGVNGGEGHTVAWPGGEAAMAPQARRGDDGEGAVRAGGAASSVRGRAHSSGVLMARPSKGATGQRRGRCSGAASAGVRARVLCARGVNAARRKGREKGDLVSGLTHFKFKIFN